MARLAFALLGAGLVLFVAGPVLKLLLGSSPESLWHTLRDPAFQASLVLTLACATVAMVVGSVLGIPLAYLLARHAFPGRVLVIGVLELPIVIPHPVAGIALLLFLGRHTTMGGVLATAGMSVVEHPAGIVAAMLFVSIPILVVSARETFEMVDPKLERVARTLGDSWWRAFRRVTLPLAGRGILAGATLAWARALSEFGAIVILTYNPKVTSVYIYDQFTSFGLNAALPAAGLLLAIAIVVFALLRLLQPRIDR